MDEVFSAVARMYQRDVDTGQPVKDADGNPIFEREIGTFVFRVPTVHDNLQMAVKRRAFLAPIGNPEAIAGDHYLLLMSEAHATIPHMVKEAPAEWDWKKIYNDMTIVEIYNAYNEGLAALRKKNTNLL